MTEDPKVPRVATEQEWNAVPRIYSNHVQVSTTPWDVVFHIGEFGLVPGPENSIAGATIQPRAIMTMSLTHAKAFASILLDTLGKREAAEREQATQQAAAK